MSVVISDLCICFDAADTSNSVIWVVSDYCVIFSFVTLWSIDIGICVQKLFITRQNILCGVLFRVTYMWNTYAYAGYGSLLWDILDVGWWIRQATGTAERHCQEEEGRYDAGMGSEPNPQATSGPAWPDEEVSTLYVATTIFVAFLYVPFDFLLKSHYFSQTFNICWFLCFSRCIWLTFVMQPWSRFS